MPTLIEMHVFSGVPNPRWTIGGEEETALKRLQQGTPAAAAADEGPGLGYRGFSVLETDPELAPKGPIHHVGNPELETFLLRSAHNAGHISTEVFEHSTQAIAAALTRFPPIREPHCRPATRRMRLSTTRRFGTRRRSRRTTIATTTPTIRLRTLSPSRAAPPATCTLP